MKNLFNIIAILSLLIVSTLPSMSQPPDKMMERYITLKKVKLLEYLDLDKATSNKVLSIYSNYSDKIFENRGKIDAIAEKLEKAIESDKSMDELKKIAEDFDLAKSDNIKLIEGMIADMRSVLNDREYAKFTLFEHKFEKEFRKRMNKARMKD